MLRMGEWEYGFSIDGGWILVEDDSLCGGRTLQEGLHARFARMHIWAVTRYTSNGPNKNTFLRLRKERALSTGKVERQLGCAPNC
ncbi:conserved hypothetical protein [Listeria monocytogenes]|nr:conserved hypothetical protein [Listeria monocytogenes]CUL63374.1 conserved hypothetical protein [Listeria monocytogenes]